MSTKQFVQHMSKQGAIWEVVVEGRENYWAVMRKEDDTTFYLPKSEFQLCDPPEVWIDVTSDTIYIPGGPGRGGIRHSTPGNAVCMIYEGYRMSLVKAWREGHFGNANASAFYIIERRQE